MSGLRKTTEDDPLSQEEALQYIKDNPDDVFWVEKIRIPVKLSKAHEKQVVHTVTLARDGRKIHETSNVTQEGYGIDTRICADGSLDQYAKKPEKVVQGYDILDGRSFEDVAVGERDISARTKGREIRRAFVATEDLYILGTWRKIQFVAKGSIVTFRGDEAIGNNNPCDMVLYAPNGTGKVVLTHPIIEVRKDAKERGLELPRGACKFLSVAYREDVKKIYKDAWCEIIDSMKNGVQMVQDKFEAFLDKRQRIKEGTVVARKKTKSKTAVKTQKKTNSR